VLAPSNYQLKLELLGKVLLEYLGSWK